MKCEACGRENDQELSRLDHYVIAVMKGLLVEESWNVDRIIEQATSVMRRVNDEQAWARATGKPPEERGKEQ